MMLKAQKMQYRSFFDIALIISVICRFNYINAQLTVSESFFLQIVKGPAGFKLVLADLKNHS